jgi:hypothetical protein
MPVDQFELLRRLKQSAMERCRERVLYARSASTEGGCKEQTPLKAQKELLRKWKTHHGL